MPFLLFNYTLRLNDVRLNFFNYTLRLNDVHLDFDVRFLNPHSISFRANVFESQCILLLLRLDNYQGHPRPIQRLIPVYLEQLRTHPQAESLTV